MGSSPTSGTRMECNEAQKNISSFLKKTLKGNKLRKTYYHIKKCDVCREVLLDEFSFYMTFNDLDKDLDFNYKRRLNEVLRDVENQIVTKDKKLKIKYILLSLGICIAFVIILVVALRIVYR